MQKSQKNSFYNLRNKNSNLAIPHTEMDNIVLLLHLSFMFAKIQTELNN